MNIINLYRKNKFYFSKEYTGDLTQFIDTFLKNTEVDYGLYTYIMKFPDKVHYVIRYHGATRGCVIVNNKTDNIIQDIIIYNDCYIYNPDLANILKKYMRGKIILNEPK